MLIPILTVLMSGVISGIVTFVLNARRSERDFRREKLETLFTVADKYCKVLATTFLDYYRIFKGELNLKEVLELHIKRSEGKESNHEKVEMLISIYFPNIYSAYQDLMAARKTVVEITLDYQRSYESGNTDGNKYLEVFDEAMKRLFETSDTLKKLILVQAQYVNAPLWMFWKKF